MSYFTQAADEQDNTYFMLKYLFPSVITIFACKNIKNLMVLLSLPLLRNIVFLISTFQIAARTGPARPYTSDIGDALTMGGTPHPPENWFNAEKALKDTLMKNGYKLIVSLLKPYEQAGTGLRWFGAQPPIQPDVWEKCGIKHVTCPVQDLTTKIDAQQALETIREMYTCVANGDTRCMCIVRQVQDAL